MTLHPEDLKVLLVYPGPEKVGLSSLAIHRIYTLLNSVEGVSCDLIFSNSKRSLFLNLHPSQFDLIAFSITYENHLFEVVKLLYSWGIEPLRERREGAPPILGGGIGLFYNPAPFLPIFDAVYLGEAEGRLEEVISTFRDTSTLEALSQFDNVMLSQDYTFSYDGLKLSSFKGPKRKIFRSSLFSKTPCHSCFLSGDTAFKDMFLIELNRGCIEKCRFCVATYMGLPYREKEIGVVEKEIQIASHYVDKVGLIGAGVSDYSKMEELYEILKRYKMKASFSSLKASSSSPYIFEIIKHSGQKTVTLAPEAGSQELRFGINKKVKDETYYSFAEKAFQAGVESLKLYFLIGLPGETDLDLEAIVHMAAKFREIAIPYWRERGGAGEIHISVNPVIAKPFTPLQWYGLNPKSQIEKKLKKLSKLIRKVPGVRLTHEGVKEAVLQAIVSRGDDRLGLAAVKVVKEGMNLRRALKEIGLPFEELYTREREKDELFPWEVVESGIRREYLWKEYRNIYERIPTPTCFPGCSACGLCPSGANLQKEEPQEV